MHDQNIVSQVGGIALVLLKTLESAAETFPPLKSVAGVGLTIGTLDKVRPGSSEFVSRLFKGSLARNSGQTRENGKNLAYMSWTL